jgi:hypothetical protein
MSSTEEIKQANAAELGHIVNQLTVSRAHRDLLSKFLLKTDDTAFGYNMKLKECISWLNQIPFSEEFVKRLVFLDEPPAAWQRHFPIEYTPKTHIIHAAYKRILERRPFGRDPHFGAPLPIVFHRQTNILTSTTSYTIDFPDRLYEVRKPFGYDFPRYIEADGILFKLIELWNPLYVKRSAFNSRYLGAPTPIPINGTYVKPYSNAVYTLLYQKYILNQQRERS